MEKIKIKYIIDIGLGAAFLSVLITGLIKFPGLVSSLGLRYSSLPLRQISLVHDWGGAIMSLLVLVHLAFDYKWIVAVTKRFFNKKECA